MPSSPHYEIIIAGGGARGSLVALALNRVAPGARILLIDRAARFGGGAIGPFSSADVPLAQRRIIEGAVVRSWTAFYVAFPGESRKLEGQIVFVAPEQIHAEVVEGLQADQWQLNTIVARCTPNEVILADGRALRADVVLDFTTLATQAEGAGIEVISHLISFDRPHDLEFPILVDASMSGSDEASFLQYFPLGGDLLEVRRLRYGQLAAGSVFELPKLDKEGGRILESSKSHFMLNEADMGEVPGDSIQSDFDPLAAADGSILPSRLPAALALADLARQGLGDDLGRLCAAPPSNETRLRNFGLAVRLARANRSGTLQMLKSAFRGPRH